ncbi:MAG: S46 family peptidase, partial [Planctomycetaceae bacterium]|nr:S46 family peptidase [Planctomycetaceae bacterium]
MKRSFFRRLLLATALIVSGSSLSSTTSADEGMWLYNNLPLETLEKKYGFKPTAEWADHLMKSSVRFNSGGSGSFVSSNGLVLTNHHVASDVLFKLSTANNNLLEQGFLAKTTAEELKAPDLELNQLISIEDVTDRINAVVKDGMSPADASKARQAEMSRVEKEAGDKSGLRCDIVTLYGGARYHLYSYKKYTDVRLVWAPETKSAFFGGDADNFEYPRFCLDTTILRVYENNEPAKIEHYLKVDADGAAENELVFVSGHPGRTRRIYTVDALRYQRDQRLPKTLDLLRRKEVLLQQYGFGGDEQTRRARDEMFGIQNSRKAYTGMIGGLQNPSYIESKIQYEAEMQKKIAADPKLAKYADAWKKVAEVQAKRQALSHQDVTIRSGIFGIAQELVLMAAEDQKPSEERLREYRESNRESLLQQLYSPAPMYDDLERVQLADELARLAETRGGEDPLVL